MEPTDAIIRMSATGVCGSDLWPYCGIQPDCPRRYAKCSDDAPCDTGTAQWQSRGVDGKGHRRTIPQVIVALTLNHEGKDEPMAVRIAALSLVATSRAQGNLYQVMQQLL